MRSAVFAAAWLLADPVGAAVCTNLDCLLRVDDGFLQDNLWYFSEGWNIVLTTPVYARFCNTSNWLSYFGCAAKCPVAFELTAPPEAAGLRLCLKDNEFEGGADLLHSDHALIGRELELAAAPATNSGGCTADGLDGVRGRVALLKAGGCDYVEQAANAGRSGAVATIIVNDRVSLLAEDTWFQKNGMGGAAPSGGLNVTMLVSRGLGQPVLDLAAAGVRFRGRFVMECDGGSPQVAVAEMKGNWDSCPTPGEMNCAALAERWGGDEVDMLCTGCVLEAVIDAGGTSDTVCLHSSAMLPFREDNSLHMAAAAADLEFEVLVLESNCRDGGGTDPWTGESCADIATTLHKYGAESCDKLTSYYFYGDTVDWASRVCQKTCNPDCARIGCSAADYAGTSGQLVFAPNAGGECEVAAVRAASAAGVAAIVLPRKHVGTSLGVGVPVHYISPTDMDRVVAAAARANRTSLRGRVRMGPGLAEPAAPAVPPHSDRAQEAVVVPAGGFTFAWPVVLCIVASTLLTALNAYIFVRQRRVSVRLVGDERDRAVRLPLSVASLGVGVSLLACITTVTFVLVYMTGKASADTALDEGRGSVDVTFANAVQQVESMRDQLLSAYSRIAALGLKDIMSGGKAGGRVLSNLFHDHDDSKGAEYFNKMADLMRAISGSAGWGEHWMWSFRSTQGHYGAANMRTVWRDGAKWVHVRGRSQDRFLNLTSFDPMKFFGRQYESAIDLARNAVAGSHVWYVCERPQPTAFSAFWNLGYRPLSVLYPMYSSAGEYVGVLEGSFELLVFADRLALAVQTAGTANMTIVLLDENSGSIVSSTIRYRNQRDTAQQTRQYDDEDDDLLTEPLTLATMPVFELVAVDAFLRATYGGLGGGLGVVHELDQAEWYAKSGQQPVRAIHVTFDGGEAVDESDSKWRMRLGGGSSVVDGRGGRCLDVDGTSSLEVYRNLSTDLPRVRDGRNVTSPRFNAAWNHTRWMGDTEVVVVPDQDPAEETAPVEWHPLLREPMLLKQHTLAMWVRPRRAYTETELDYSAGPSLWTDSLTSSAVRITAAGRMVVRGLQGYRGCVTAPYPGGLPVGAWTHVTAQLDVWDTRFTLERQGRPLRDRLYAQMCRVFINGTLHSEHPLSAVTYTYDTIAETASPYRVGHGFDGQIDDVVLYNVTLSAGEVRQLAETGTLKRVAPSRRFYALVSKFAEEGLRWLTLVTLPRDDVMREVDRLHEQQLQNQRVRRDNTDKELSQRSVETVLATVVIALASVAVFLLCNEALTRPIGKLALQLLEVSVMQVDGVGEERSWIEEVDAMHVAMSVVATNLREYKQYLPQSLLVVPEADLGDESAPDCREQPRLDSGGIATLRSSVRSGKSITSGGEERSPRSSLVPPAAQPIASVHQNLQHKGVSLAVINVVGHRSFVREHIVQAVATFHDEYLQEIAITVAAAKGIVDVFVGDRVSMSYNAMRRCGQHRLMAVSSTLQLTESTEDRRLSGSAVTGTALCGSLGTVGLRRFSVIGSVATIASLYERVCVQHGARMLVDDSLRTDTEEFFCYRLAECVVFPKISQRPCYMFEVRTRLEGSGGDDQGEWMYCLEARQERAQKRNPWTRYNAAQRARWGGGNVDSILRHLDGPATGGQADAAELRYRDEREQELQTLVRAVASDPKALRPIVVAEVGRPLVQVAVQDV